MKERRGTVEYKMPQSSLNPDRSLDILIVCTGNICRSPMAEGLLKSMWPSGLDRQAVIHSAGTHAAHGLPAEPYAIRVAGEYGANIRSHRSRPLSPALLKRADLIMAMEQRHVDFIRHLAGDQSGRIQLLCGLDERRLMVDVPDPYGGSLDTYRECARMISGCLRCVIEGLMGIIGGTKAPGEMSGLP